MSTHLLIENASKSFGDISLFQDITFNLNKGMKVALIAKNGSGKTTLLNILAGKDSFDSGSYYVNKEIKIGYLEQDPKFDPGLTMFQAIYDSSGKLMETVRNYEQALHRHDDKALEEAAAQMDIHQAWDFDSKINQMLGVLKLENEDQLIGTLSGGQVKRLALAVTLINEPHLLILDEPTNHLDLDMIEWLEDYLLRSNLTLLMVTHDRYFLDRICNEILEMDERSIYSYKGNYSYFLQKREERLLNKVQMVEKAQNLLRTELEWMRRMPKARTTKAKYRIDAFYDLKQQSEYRRNDRKVEINVKTSRMGKKILVMENISKSFDDTVILKDFSYSFTRGEKIGIIGRNGVGKTTFLNIITQKIQADSGNLDQGETVVYGFYQQQGMDFKPGQRVIDIIREIAEVVTLSDGHQLSVTQFLNHFLFTPEMQYVQVEKLSGGEKRRLYLMTVLMRNPNFLILDEPTNDFDILTLNVLEDYLANFGGCLIIVSHDRFFMDKLVDHLFIFEGNGEVYDFPGNYSEYRASQKQQEIEARRNEIQTGNVKNGIVKNDTVKNGNVKSGSLKKGNVIKSNGKSGNLKTGDVKTGDVKTGGVIKESGPLAKKKLTFKEKQEFEALTAEIESLENEKTALEAALSSGILNPDELMVKSTRFGEITALLDEKSDRWLELGEKEGM